MNFDESETHESYGIVGISRRQSSPPHNLFGSSIKHQSTMALTIKKAEKMRDLNRDWYFGRKHLIEIELSPTQFADMITGVGVGDGVPCTIRWAEGERKENPPEISQRQMYEDEFKKTMQDFGKTCYGDVQEARELLTKKGTITVKERKQVDGIITRMVGTITGTLPFIQGSFNEAMSKTVTEAKGEVDAFVMDKIISLGIEGLKDKVSLLNKDKVVLINE